jgi:hypothetical protein
MVRIEEDTLQPLGQLVGDVPLNVDRAVMKGLAVRTSERWQSMVAFQAVLRSQDMATDVSDELLAVDSDSGQVAVKRRAFNRFKWITTLLISLLLLGAAGWYYFPVHVKPEMGDYVQFGKYNNQPILWRIIHFEDENTAMLFSDKILTLKEFDAPGEEHINPDSDREQFGSNYYRYSNIRQWLNSSDEQIDWIQNPPSYEKEKGFLADGNFTEEERNFIKPRTHKVILAGVDKDDKDGGSEQHEYEGSINTVVQNYNTAWYQMLEDWVFLLSVKDVHDYVYANSAIPEKDYHFGYPNAEAVNNAPEHYESLKNGEYWYYLLNSPYAETSGNVRAVGDDGGVLDSNAYFDASGVRPALLVNLSSAIFTSDGDGSKQKPFVVQAE